MLLDKGFCSIYQVTNTAAPGDMPVDGLVLKHQSWYGELEFSSAPTDIAAQEGIVVSNKIRILQNRSVTNHDVAVLSYILPPTGDAPRYNVVRAFHGTEDGEPITDLSLERLVQE